MTRVQVRLFGVIMVASSIALSACAPRETVAEKHSEANTAAGKLGQAAHKVAVEADKAGRVIGRKLDKAAHDAKEGWNEDARKTQSKK